MLKSRGFLLGLKKISFVFETFNEILLALIQFVRFFRSLLIQIGYSLLNMIQIICLLIHIFHNDTICSTECYDPQYQKPYEGQQKYHKQSYHHLELSLLPQSDLTEHTKLNNTAESQTVGYICCFY